MLLLDASTDPRLLDLQAGGKARNLARLERLGLPVPPWSCLPAHAMEQSLRAASLFEDFSALLQAHAAGPPARTAERLAAILRRTPLSAETQALLDEARAATGPGPWAVRSSGLGEDSARHSFAGVHDSFLDVPTDRLAERVRDCWISAFSGRALAYRRERGLPWPCAGPAVIIQAMVDADRAGVLFTCDPVTGDEGTWTLQAVRGRGDAYVSGQDEGQGWTLDREGRILSSPEDPLLPPASVRALHALAAGARSSSRDPVDLEWAISREGIAFLLQMRPVTSPHPSARGRLDLWDNSNIFESYGGLTSPLSFSFARGLYHRVYVRFCQVMGVRSADLTELEPALRNMLGLVHGRVYYNLLNWYRLTGILPGYRFNRAFMESMMGVPRRLEAEIAERIRPPAFATGARAALRKARTGLRFLRRGATIDRDVARFLEGFHADYSRALDLPFESMDAGEALSHYDRIERSMLARWDVPIVNDFLCMVHHGIFRGLCRRWLGEEAETIGNDLLASGGHLESAAPMLRLHETARHFLADAEAARIVLETPDALCHEALSRAGKGRLLGLVDQWIRAYGFRCMDEMKLESRDLHLEPERFYPLLRNLLRSPAPLADHGPALRARAEASVRRRLSPLRRPLFRWSLSKARQAVRHRENTRFCRTRIYGVARRLLRVVARDFASRGLIHAEDDLFFLELHEVRGAVEGTSTCHDLQALVDARRASYACWEGETLPSRFLTRGPVQATTFDALAAPGDTLASPRASAGREGGEGGSVLRGTACGPGLVEGIARVVSGPSDDLALRGEILVAERTDPGWIPLYPAISGLAVERGGLLSHSAVVAREMGIPTVVGVEGLLATVRSGMRVRLDGARGTLEILTGPPAS